MSEAETHRGAVSPATDPQMVELMAKAAYEASRPPGSSRPAWADCTDFWRDASRREMAAALAAARAAGYRIDAP